MKAYILVYIVAQLLPGPCIHDLKPRSPVYRKSSWTRCGLSGMAPMTVGHIRYECGGSPTKSSEIRRNWLCGRLPYRDYLETARLHMLLDIKIHTIGFYLLISPFHCLHSSNPLFSGGWLTTYSDSTPPEFSGLTPQI